MEVSQALFLLSPKLTFEGLAAHPLLDRGQERRILTEDQTQSRIQTIKRASLRLG